MNWVTSLVNHKITIEAQPEQEEGSNTSALFLKIDAEQKNKSKKRLIIVVKDRDWYQEIVRRFSLKIYNLTQDLKEAKSLKKQVTWSSSTFFLCSMIQDVCLTHVVSFIQSEADKRILLT